MILSTLTSIQHNQHYLNRYLRLLERHATVKKIPGKTELHHICPKSLFPQYQNLKKNAWNKAHLPARVHYIAHQLLCRIFNDGKLDFALWAMCNQHNAFQDRTYKVNSKTYAEFKEKSSKWMSESRSGVALSVETKKKLKDAHGANRNRLENSFRQQASQVQQIFGDIENGIQLIMVTGRQSWWLPRVIAKKLNVTEGFIKTVLRIQGIKINTDPNVTKVFNNYGHQFDSYESYCTAILTAHERGQCITQIANTLNINISGVKGLLKRNNIIPNFGKPGPPKGYEFRTTPGIRPGTVKWFSNDIICTSTRSAITLPPPWYLGRLY